MTRLDIGMIQNYISSILVGSTTVEYLDEPGHLSANSGVYRVQGCHWGFTFYRIFDECAISAYEYTEEDIAYQYVDSFIRARVNQFFNEDGQDELESLQTIKMRRKEKRQ